MQTLICSLIIICAAIYVAHRWLPTKIKQRLMKLVGSNQAKASLDNPTGGTCGTCSSCGNCASNSEKLVKK